MSYDKEKYIPIEDYISIKENFEEISKNYKKALKDYTNIGVKCLRHQTAEICELKKNKEISEAYDSLLAKHVKLQDEHIALSQEFISLKQAVNQAGQKASEFLKQELDK